MNLRPIEQSSINRIRKKAIKLNKVVERVLEGLAAAGGFIAGLYGGWDGMMTVLVCCMAIDYVLGLLCAFTGKSTKTEGGHFLSSVAFTGLMKKAVIMLVVLLATALDQTVSVGETAFRSAAVFFYIACEGLSALENCVLLGVPVPAAVRRALEAVKNKEEKEQSPPEP